MKIAFRNIDRGATSFPDKKKAFAAWRAEIAADRRLPEDLTPFARKKNPLRPGATPLRLFGPVSTRLELKIMSTGIRRDIVAFFDQAPVVCELRV